MRGIPFFVVLQVFVLVRLPRCMTAKRSPLSNRVVRSRVQSAAFFFPQVLWTLRLLSGDPFGVIGIIIKNINFFNCLYDFFEK